MKVEANKKDLALTVKVASTALTATVKADKNKIDLVARQRTMFVYTPTIKGTTTPIRSVALADDSKASGAYRRFNVKLVDGKVVLTAREDAVFNKGASCMIRLAFTLDNAAQDVVSTKDITVKPIQSKVTHSIPAKTAMFQGRTGVHQSEVIDLAPLSPNGARIESLTFKAESKAGVYKNNPGNAFWYYFDEDAQQLHIWIRDGALAKPGKNTLVFSALYEGQGLERVSNAYQAKPVTLKVPIAVA